MSLLASEITVSSLTYHLRKSGRKIKFMEDYNEKTNSYTFNRRSYDDRTFS